MIIDPLVNKCIQGLSEPIESGSNLTKAEPTGLAQLKKRLRQ